MIDRRVVDKRSLKIGRWLVLEYVGIAKSGELLFERVEKPVKTQQELEYEQLMAKIEELKQQVEKLKPSA